MGKFIPKITSFGNFTCQPTFLKLQPWSLAWGYGPGTPWPMPNFVKIAQKIAQGGCRYCIAPRRWCILISSIYFSFVIYVLFLKLQHSSYIYICFCRLFQHYKLYEVFLDRRIHEYTVGLNVSSSVFSCLLAFSFVSVTFQTVRIISFVINTIQELSCLFCIF